MSIMQYSSLIRRLTFSRTHALIPRLIPQFGNNNISSYQQETIMFRKFLNSSYTLVQAHGMPPTHIIKNCCKKENSSDKAARFTRMLCSPAPSNSATFEEVKKAGVENKKVVIIDVREPWELQETGVLPGSINIPLGEIESVLRDCPPEEFFQKYGREKPDKDSPMIISCRSGKRSASAQAVCEQLGFKCVKNYIGGWIEWEEKTKSI